MNSHVLLTGATGLLGRYLVRDLLLADVPIAVLVRPSRRQSAEQRVEAIMRFWETELHRPLSRPHVLSGDITNPLLGLSREDAQWVEQHCDSLLHNAASLTFHSDGPEGEPWRSNVQGIENVLATCEELQIWDFHHVSTAYVCGLRKGRVLETELDVGQEFGNDYEISKVRAETLVRAAGFLETKTIYRPAIIIGDSETGFTTTFHGFYHVLRLVCTLASSPEIWDACRDDNPERVPTRLTLSGQEAKNLVPVDWVSAAISRLVQDRRHYGKTYNLTAREPVTIAMMQDVFEEMIGFRNTIFCGCGELEDPTIVERLFYEHLQTYAAYWRDDPVFDCTNTLAALPDLPCPNVDVALMLKLAHAAVELNFRWSDPPVREATKVTV
jgi:thioester reductase-like protein